MEQIKTEDAKQKSVDKLIQEIAECLAQWDAESVVEIANSILTIKHRCVDDETVTVEETVQSSSKVFRLKVYVLEYSHKYGSDLSAYSSAKLAELGIFQIMQRWLSDFEETASSMEDGEKMVSDLRDAIEQKDLVKATQLWADVANEGFDVSELEVAPDWRNQYETLHDRR